MARHGLKAMVTLNGERLLDEVLRAYQAACERHGRHKMLGQDMVWGAGLYLARTEEEAIRRLEPAHDERFKWFAPFGFVRYADEHGRPWGTPGAPARVPALRDGIRQKAWFCGPPAQVIDGIKSIADKYPGLENFMIHWAEGLAPNEFKDQLAWFAEEVMPAFKGRATIPAAEAEAELSPQGLQE
jgi:alkanesulfonate monooxygenase SsuD/methylene tetrahydromethanopterin reductase-like flavin-dependent oxidoreductase (luciferase family)